MMISPEVKDLRRLDIDERTKKFLCCFLAIVRKYPHNRILLFAWIFCAYEFGVSTRCVTPAKHEHISLWRWCGGPSQGT